MLDVNELINAFMSIMLRDLKIHCRQFGLKLGGNKKEVAMRLAAFLVKHCQRRNAHDDVAEAVRIFMAARAPHVRLPSHIGELTGADTLRGAAGSSYAHGAVGQPPRPAASYSAVKLVVGKRPLELQPVKMSCPCKRELCLSATSEVAAKVLVCTHCGGRLHAHCMGLSEVAVSEYTCPRCRAETYDPFLIAAPGAHVLATTLLPPYVGGTIGFTLTQAHFRSLHSVSSAEPELVLRVSSFAGPSRTRFHRWPTSVMVSLNSSALPLHVVHFLPMAINGGVTGVQFKDRNKDEPLYLTAASGIRIGTNELLISHRDTIPHIVEVAILTRRSVGEVLDTVKAAATESVASAHQRVLDSFRLDDDLQTTHIKLSLTCPLSRLRMTTPARCTGCRHLECFELSAYLDCQHVSKVPKWECPLCQAPGALTSLRIDGWLLQVISELPASICELRIEANGSYEGVEATASTPKRVDTVNVTELLDMCSASRAVGETTKQTSRTAMPVTNGSWENPIELD